MPSMTWTLLKPSEAGSQSSEERKIWFVFVTHFENQYLNNLKSAWVSQIQKSNMKARKIYAIIEKAAQIRAETRIKENNWWGLFI